MSEDQAMADEWAAAMEEDKQGKSSEASKKAGSPDLDVILDIPVRISMEVGSTAITIRNLLQLNQGSVIELDRLAGEPLDVLVNGTLIAHGEVVVVNDKFGIRMTDVISPSERIKKLR
jgi:flagellar motor switch protein FliN/FliY